jgi:hypothetical protein
LTSLGDHNRISGRHPLDDAPQSGFGVGKIDRLHEIP